jgi:predicted ATPase/DNA-binding SARP family transcriptional activator
MLEIRTLGGLLITEDGEPIMDFRSNKAQALLVYLAVEGRMISRGELIGLLWPESSEKHAMTSLRVVLSTLRQRVGAYLDISRSHLVLKPDAEIYFDGIDLEEKVARGDIEGALALNSGDFLTGFDIRESAAFDEWRLLVQERYRWLLIAALHRTTSDAIDQGDREKGLRLAGKLLDLDPIDEAGYRYMMQLLTQDGRRSAALLLYEKLQEILDKELGVTPSQETEDLFRRITQNEIPAAPKSQKTRNNLPAPQTSFINRVQELIQIDSMIGDPNCRLLSLVGPGGVGKTRLAIEAARRNLDNFSEGIYFVNLGPLSSSEYIIPAIADALNFKIDSQASDQDPKNQLLDFLEDRFLLLVMDSFEHLISDAGLVSEIITRATRIKVMATSRERLGLGVEWVFKLDGLKVPEASRGTSPEKDSAIQLFVERACQVNRNFQASFEELDLVAAACQLVEGMPLGIELAAAWSSMLSCREIYEQINRNLDFLSTKLHDTPLKHRSMRAIFDQSWDLLTKVQQKNYRELSVFQGGFSMDAASWVTGTSMEQLSNLMDKSLLTRDDSGRFGMHNSLRHYASEKLKDEEKTAEVKERHAQYYVGLLLQRVDDLMGSDLVPARDILRRDIENLRIGIDWSVIHWEPVSARNALDGFFAFYIVQGWHEGKDAFKRLSQLISKKRGKAGVSTLFEDPVYLSAQTYYAFLCTLLGFSDEGEMISNECLEPCHALGMESERSILLHNLGVIAEQRGEYERARVYLEQAITLGSEHPNIGFPTYYLWLGYVYFMLGDFSQGMACFQESYDLFDKKNTLWGKGFALSKMGLAADGLGEYNLAIEYSREALSIFETIEDYFGIAYSYSRLSVGMYFIGSFDQALEHARKSYQMFGAINHRWGLGASLCRMGFAYIGIGEIPKASACFDEALQISWKAQNVPLSLYALAGTACWNVVEGNCEPAIGLFNYIQQHPQTPALYVEAAKIWFEGIDFGSPPVGESIMGESGKLASLNEVVDWVLGGKELQK